MVGCSAGVTIQDLPGPSAEGAVSGRGSPEEASGPCGGVAVWQGLGGSWVGSCLALTGGRGGGGGGAPRGLRLHRVPGPGDQPRCGSPRCSQSW